MGVLSQSKERIFQAHQAKEGRDRIEKMEKVSEQVQNVPKKEGKGKGKGGFKKRGGSKAPKKFLDQTAFSYIPKATRSEDLKKMIACRTHLGTRNLEDKMKPYVYDTRGDGINIINVAATWEKLMIAARILAGIDNPQDIIVISSRQYGQRAALRFARHTGARAMVGRFTPGSFTNQIQKVFVEPRVIITTDPRADGHAIVEATYANIPVISFADTDNSLRYIDVAIPCNNKGKQSIGLMYWLLTREILRLKGKIPRTEEWEVMPDMFFHREQEEIDEQIRVEEQKRFDSKKSGIVVDDGDNDELKEGWTVGLTKEDEPEGGNQAENWDQDD